MKKIFFAFIFIGITYSTVAFAAPANFALTYQGRSFPVNGGLLASWNNKTVLSGSDAIRQPPPSPYALLQAYTGTQAGTGSTQTSYDYEPQKIYDFVQDLTENINTPTQEPKLIIDNGKVATFTPPQNGITVDVYQTTLHILDSLEQNATSTEISASTTSPKTLLSDTNTLGINELIGEGVSSFKGSPANRIHNIKVGVQTMTGIIVAPGAEFSFDNYLGPVDKQHGYLPELVILNNATVPEDGGGLCQVSTTTFRAAMQAGLPITDRKNHAYAVSYYSPQGTDATIYPGSADLKFINNTPGRILIWPYFKDPTTLIFDFYGTKDDRQVVLHKPDIFDRKSDGSMKATWTRDVTLNGVITTSVFKSNYLPPALFHKSENSKTDTGTGAPTGFYVGQPSPNTN